MKKILLFFFLPLASIAQTLDGTFHSDGIRTDQVTNMPSGQYAFDATLQPDGKIVYVGRIVYPFVNSFAARYNNDGSKDDTFNQYGFKKFSSLGFQTVAIQSDGSLLFAGRSEIIRVLSNGSSDLTFNGTGAKTITFNGQPMNIKRMSVQPDGKILASGYISTGNNDFILIRLNNDGTPDSSFDTDGIVTLSFGTGNDEAFCHNMQTDGKIIISGQSFNGTDYDFALARINPDGTMDTSFGTGGKVVTPFAAGTDFSRSGEILSDGSIILLGASGGKIALAKYLPDGTLDNTFSGDGKLLLNENSSASTISNATSFHAIHKLKITANNKIIIAATSDNNYKVIKLLADGSYDTTFSASGVFVADEAYDSSVFLIEKADGTIISGGTTAMTAPSADIHTVKIKEIKITPDGLSSVHTVDLYYAYDQLSVGAIRKNDQSIIVATNTHNRIDTFNTRDVIIIQKLLPNGNRDINYGSFGYQQIINNTSIINGKVTKVIQLPDDSTILKGPTEIYKITPSGALDNSFGTGGRLDISSLNSSLSFLDDIILTNDNKILLACDQSLSSPLSIQTAIVKINLNGTLDNTFGTNGITGYSPTNQASTSEWPNALYQDSNNKIIISSEALMGTEQFGSKLCLARLNPNGTFDTSFGNNGIYTHTHTPSIRSYTIAGTANNSYLVNFYEPSKSFTLKIDNNGSIDTSFGTNAEAADSPGTFNKSMITQADGKFIKAGYKNNQLSLSRYNPDGSPDTSFGSNGEINTYTGYESVIETIQFQNDGKLIAIGNSFDGGMRHIIILRYTDITLGTIDFETAGKTLLVYPNPIENNATFEYFLDNNENISVTLFDMQGKEIKQIVKNHFQQRGKHTLPLSLENLSTGNYILKIKSGKGSQSIQILKK